MWKFGKYLMCAVAMIPIVAITAPEACKVFAVPQPGVCLDCDCKEVGAYSIDKGTTVLGYRKNNNDGTTAGVKYAQLAIGAVGSCQKGIPKNAVPAQTVYLYQYFSTNQTCTRIPAGTIEYTYTDNGAQYQNTAWTRKSCQ
jgi:hypothetical protein